MIQKIKKRKGQYIKTFKPSSLRYSASGPENQAETEPVTANTINIMMT